MRNLATFKFDCQSGNIYLVINEPYHCNFNNKSKHDPDGPIEVNTTWSIFVLFKEHSFRAERPERFSESVHHTKRVDIEILLVVCKLIELGLSNFVVILILVTIFFFLFILILFCFLILLLLLRGWLRRGTLLLSLIFVFIFKFIIIVVILLRLRPLRGCFRYCVLFLATVLVYILFLNISEEVIGFSFLIVGAHFNSSTSLFCHWLFLNY